MGSFRAQQDGIPAIAKSLLSTLDYTLDWSGWLAIGETIASNTVTVAQGLTLASSSATSTAVTSWLSGGTAGTSYLVTVKIVTSANRTDERSMRVEVRQR